MRLHKLSRNVSVLALAVAVGACGDGLTDMNVNPNQPTDVASSFLLRQSLQTSVGNMTAVGMSWNHPGLWVQQVAKIQYANEDRYDPRQDFFQNLWDALYVGPLKDFEAIIEKSRKDNRPQQEAVGLIMKSWTFGIMTDMWGDLPYSEALQGEGGAFTPKYDTQQEIYNGLFADLKKADQLLAAGGKAGFGNADLIYGDDAVKWRKFANSLRLRLAMHLSKVDPAKAKTEFEAAIATGAIISSNADNARLKYTGSSPNVNPLYDNVLTRDDHRISATMVDALKGLNDPRLPVYAQPISADGKSYVGYANGQLDNAVPLAQASKVGKDFLAAGAPAYLLTFSEVQFLRAEAAARGWNAGGTAAALYASGIEAAMNMYGVSAAETATYLAQPAVQYDAANWQRQVGTQKWIALYMQGAEAWTEWRRTGYPQIAPGPHAKGDVPRRFWYPTLESSLNKANLDTAMGRQPNAGSLTGRVWWDK